MENKLNILKVSSSNELMGVEFVDGELTFRVPETFREEKDESLNRHNLLLFVKSLSLSNTDTRPEIKKSDEEGGSWPIDSYLWIIRDYLENGYYYNREKKYSNSGKGKIEWKKTLKNTPIVSDRNIIYDKLVTSVTAPSNDLIAQIYRLCLKIAQARIGWVFGYTIFVDVNITRSVAEMKRTLTNELSSTFDDVKRVRFRHMQYILNSTEEKDVSNFRFSQLIRNYYHVYEIMIDKLLKGVSEKERRRYNPSGSWTRMGHSAKESSVLEPDTVLKQFGNTYIVDAKMYRYGITGHVGDLPESSSIQKQLSYGDHAMNNIAHDDTVRNAFIIPYNKEENPLSDDEYELLANDNLLYVGYAEGDWREKKSVHDKVYTYLIDFNYLLNNYNTSESNTTLCLCKDIEEKILADKISRKEITLDGNGRALGWFGTDDIKLEIPFFQRPYIWDVEEWSALFEGIKETDEENMPFIGSFILQETAEKKKYLVIDGQQRITTLSVLIKAFLDGFSEIPDDARLELKNMIYSRKSGSKMKSILVSRLTPSQVDKDDYNLVMEQENKGTGIGVKGKIAEAYKYFYNNFKQMSEEENLSFGSKLLTSNKFFISITLEDNDDE